MNAVGTIRTLIAANSTANGLLSGRVYTDVLPQNSTYPAVAVNLINTSPTNTKTTASDLDFLLMQVDVYSTTLASAAETAEAVRGAIDYKTSGSLAHIEFKNEYDAFSGKPELHRRLQEYTISLKR